MECNMNKGCNRAVIADIHKKYDLETFVLCLAR